MTTKSIQDITAICVTHNTASLFRRCYEAFRRAHPDMELIVVDGSTAGDPCREYVRSINSGITHIYLADYNIGHGRGMDYAIRQCRTPFALIFDSDTEIIRSPVQAMLDMMEPDTYAVGYLEKSYFNGFEFGSQPGKHPPDDWMMMIHPMFHLLQTSEYGKFHPYVHHGAPTFLASLDIHKHGLTGRILKQFPGLGHTAGKGFTWRAVQPVWVRHDTAGTRNDRRSRGKSEIEGPWVYR